MVDYKGRKTKKKCNNFSLKKSRKQKILEDMVSILGKVTKYVEIQFNDFCSNNHPEHKTFSHFSVKNSG